MCASFETKTRPVYCISVQGKNFGNAISVCISVHSIRHNKLFRLNRAIITIRESRRVLVTIIRLKRYAVRIVSCNS